MNYFYRIIVDDVPLDASRAVKPNAPNGAGHQHYDLASAWMDSDAATEELHRY